MCGGITLKKYSGFIVDFYGTLVEDDRDMIDLFITEWQSYFGVSAKRAEIKESWTNLYIQLREVYKADKFLSRSRIQAMVLTRLFKIYGIKCSPEDYAVRLFEQRTMATPYEKGLELLEYFKSANIDFIILTDGDNVEVNSVIVKHNIFCGKGLLTSQDTGYYKPSIQIFHAGLEVLGKEKENVIVIGDSHWSDVIGAKNAGIDSIWYDRLNRNLPKPANCVKFTKLEGLLNHVKKITIENID